MGDIFNSTRPDAESIRVFREGLALMTKAGLPVYAIQGQHDRALPPWPVAVDENIQYVHQKVFVPIAGGPMFYALDNYANPVELKEELSNMPDTVHTVVLHQLMREVFPMEGVWDADTEWLPKHVNTLFVGDFHEPVEFTWDGGRGWYSGSTYMCKIDEPYTKSVLRAKLLPNGELGVDRVPLITRPFTEQNISTEADLDACVKIMTEDPLLRKKHAGVKKPVVVINYLTTVVGVEARLVAAIDNRAHLWLRPRTVRLDTDFTLEKSTMRVPMEACVKKFLQDGTQEYQFMMDVLRRPLPEVFEEWKHKLALI